jgi:hypothetical protein
MRCSGYLTNESESVVIDRIQILKAYDAQVPLFSSPTTFSMGLSVPSLPVVLQMTPSPL